MMRQLILNPSVVDGDHPVAVGRGSAHECIGRRQLDYQRRWPGSVVRFRHAKKITDVVRAVLFVDVVDRITTQNGPVHADAGDSPDEIQIQTQGFDLGRDQLRSAAEPAKYRSSN